MSPSLNCGTVNIGATPITSPLLSHCENTSTNWLFCVNRRTADTVSTPNAETPIGIPDAISVIGVEPTRGQPSMTGWVGNTKRIVGVPGIAANVVDAAGPVTLSFF